MGVLMDKTVGKAVNFVFNGALKGTKTAVKGAAKATMAVGGVSEKLVEDVGNATIGTAKAVGKVGKKTGKLANKTLTKELTGKTLENATLYERTVGKKLNAAGIGVAAGATMAISTGGAMLENGGSRFQKIGYTSVGENLDRLVSYDGSGFINNINKVSNGDPEVMQDIVKNSFNNVNQTGVSGDIVFALHNMREG